MTVRTGIIAASATSAATSAAPTSAAGCGSHCGAGTAEPGRVVIRRRRKPDLIELGRMRVRRGGGHLGRFILCARFRGITRRRIVRRLRRRGSLNGFRVLVLGRRGFERGGEKLFVGNQRGNEERPGQETKRAGSLVRTLHPGFEDLPLLFEQFTLFYFVHDCSPSFRSTQKLISPGSIHCRASLFGGSGVMPDVVQRLRRDVEMPCVEVIR